MAKIQNKMASLKEQDETWLINGDRYLKEFVRQGDEVQEGWNEYSLNVMITMLAQVVSENGFQIDCCSKCGLGHSKSFACMTNFGELDHGVKVIKLI